MLSWRTCFLAIVTGVLTTSATPYLDEGQSLLNGTGLKALPGVVTVPTQWFVARSEADHQSDLDDLPPNGWRLASLSVYGTPPDHRYATVWVQRPGPIQQTAIAVDGPSFDSWRNYWTAQGYVPVILTITGDINAGLVSAAVLEKISVTSWNIVSDLSKTNFDNAAASARNSQQKMVSIDQYNTFSEPWFCAVFHYNQNNDGWSYNRDQSLTAAQSTLRSETTKPYWRPIFLKP